MSETTKGNAKAPNPAATRPAGANVTAAPFKPAAVPGVAVPTSKKNSVSASTVPSATRLYPASERLPSSADATTTTVPHPVTQSPVPTGAVSPYPQEGQSCRTARTNGSNPREYDQRQREILRRGQLAGQGVRPVSNNPLANGASSECLDSEGRPKRLQSITHVRRVKRDDGVKPLLPSWLAKLLCIALQLIIMAFLVAGVAVTLYKLKDTTKPARCFNFWGRMKCGTHQYAVKGKPTWECDARANTVRTALVFGLLGLAFSVIIIIVLGFKYFFKTRALNVTIYALAFLNCILLIFPFALIAVVYTVRMCDNIALRTAVSYGPSLPLYIVAWVLTLAFLLLIFFILP